MLAALGRSTRPSCVSRDSSLSSSRRQLEALELHLFRIDRDALDLDVVAQEHRLELEHVVEQAQVALELGHDRAAAQVLQVE